MRVDATLPCRTGCSDITTINVEKDIQSYLSAVLGFMVERGLLWKLRSETSRSRIDKSQEPISLEYFIKERSDALTEKTKRVLAVLLSYAVFHLYGTPWLQPT